MRLITQIIMGLSFSCILAQPFKSEMVEVTNDIKLATDIYKQDGIKNGPVILIRTPYDKTGIDLIINHFTSNKYIVVVQDVRGKYESEGKFIPFLNETSDGKETLDWISNQEWCNGNICMWGSSYLGHASLILSNLKHPSLKSIFCISGWINSDLINSPGGAFHQMLVIPWLIFEGQKTQVSIKGLDMDEIFNHIPLEEVIPNMNFDSNSDGLDELELASKLNNSFSYNDINIPIMHVTGWYDFTGMASVEAYRKAMESSKSTQNLIIGPWYHNQLYAEDKYLGDYKLNSNTNTNLKAILDISIEWFDKTTKESNKKLDDNVKYYVLFEDEWRNSKVWPPIEINENKYYFSKDSLSLEKTSKSLDESKYTKFTYDPLNPTSTAGGANFDFFLDKLGVKNQIEIEKRNDVITFTTVPFKEEKIVAGSIATQLFIETEGKSTDFTAKLTKVDTDGNSWNLVDGITRITKIQKENEPLRVEIKMGDIAFKLEKGERLRVQISSSNFPKYDRNPNTGEDPWKATKFVAVEQTVHHSNIYLSYITIPFLKH